MNKFIFLLMALLIAVFMFLGLMNASSGRAIAKQCKEINAECKTNDSDKACCAGLVCQPFNHRSHTGKCVSVVTPTPTPIDECEKDCEPTTTPTVEPTETPEPTPEPIPTEKACVGHCGSAPTFAGSSTNPPVCSAHDPQAVDNPHVYRNGDTAIVKWYPKDGNKAHIYYKQVDSADWQYSVTVENTGYAEIHGLGSMDISFAVQAVNDCSGGTSVLSKTIVDGDTSDWILFR